MMLMLMLMVLRRRRGKQVVIGVYFSVCMCVKKGAGGSEKYKKEPWENFEDTYRVAACICVCT